MADITKLTNVDWTDEDQSKEAIAAVCDLIAVNPDDEEDEKVKQFVTRLRQTVGDIANAVMADTEEGAAETPPEEGAAEGADVEEGCGAAPAPKKEEKPVSDSVDWLGQGTVEYINDNM